MNIILPFILAIAELPFSCHRRVALEIDAGQIIQQETEYDVEQALPLISEAGGKFLFIPQGHKFRLSRQADQLSFMFDDPIQATIDFVFQRQGIVLAKDEINSTTEQVDNPCIPVNEVSSRNLV